MRMMNNFIYFLKMNYNLLNNEHLKKILVSDCYFINLFINNNCLFILKQLNK